MAVVLAIEPDARQAAVLKRVVRERVHAEITVVDSKDAAIAAIDAHVPDVILVTALLSPRDEEDLVDHLKTLQDADHLQTITIPLLATSGHGIDDDEGGFLKKAFKRKRKPDSSTVGCDPWTFADQVSGYLRSAADARAAQLQERMYKQRAAQGGMFVDVASLHAEPVVPDDPLPRTQPMTPAEPVAHAAAETREPETTSLESAGAGPVFNDPEYAFSWRSSSEPKAAGGPAARSDKKRKQQEDRERENGRRRAEEQAREQERLNAEANAREQERQRADEAAREEARRRAEEQAREDERKRAEARAKEEERRRAEERAREEDRRRAEERAREEARRRADEEARAEERRRAEARAKEEERRRAEERAREEDRRRAEDRAREEARRRAEEEGRAEERRRAEARAKEEERRRAEEQAREVERRRAEEEAREEERRRAEARAREDERRRAEEHAREEKARKEKERKARQGKKVALKPLRRLPPLAVWARLYEPAAEETSAVAAPDDDLIAIFSDLRVPPNVLPVSYPRRPCIQRVRTAA